MKLWLDEINAFLAGTAGFGQPLTLGVIVFRLLVAVVIGAVIGIEREIKNRPAGMRTHVLVGVGAAMIALIEQQTIACVAQLGADSAVGLSVGRITSTVISGVGFLGAGTIVMSDRRISGLTTAGSLWCMACIGLTAGYGFAYMALIAGVIVLVVLKLLQRIVHVQTLKKLEVRFIHRNETLPFINEYFAQLGVKVLDIDFHAETRPEGNQYTNLYTLSIPKRASYVDIIETLSEHNNIQAVHTRNI